MDDSILVVALIIFPIVFLVSICIDLFQIGPDRRTYKYAKRKYKIEIPCECVEIGESKITKEWETVIRDTGTDGYNKHRSKQFIPRPTYKAFVGEKCYTFCRRKDHLQPKAVVGEKDVILIRDINHIDCKDFYTKKEIKQGLAKYSKITVFLRTIDIVAIAFFYFMYQLCI